MGQQVADVGNSLLVQGVSATSAQIGVGFMRSLSSASKENIVISPISLQVILNLILLGAKLESQTEDELVKFLGYKDLKSSDRDGPHAGMLQVANMLHQSATTGSGLSFDMANLILAKIPPNPDYTKMVDKFYRNTKWEQFSKEIKEGELVKRIDGWIANVTHNEITNLAKSLKITPDHLMILTNAAYFRGEWLHQFQASQTTEMPFYNQGLEGQQKKVKFMQQTASFQTIDFTPIAKSETSKREGGLSQSEKEYLELTEKLDCRAISLPFSANKGNELDMVILLPNKRDGLGSMLGNLTGSYLKMVLRELDGETSVKIRVELPKFTFEHMFDVRQAMQASGVNRIFSNSAELDRMFSGSPVKVDQIMHKAKVTVDEKGAVAAAATVATVMLRSSQHWLPVKPFRADHPFLFVIRHKPTGMPTFLGSVVNF